MTKQFLIPDNFISSLRIAICTHPDPKDSIKRIRGIISKLPQAPLYVTRDHGWVCFYEGTETGKTYLRKRSDKLYLLARNRYLHELMKTLLFRIDYGYDSPKCANQFEQLAKLIRDFANGNLDIARIALTPKQYNWFTGSYRQKPLSPVDGIDTLLIAQGVNVRSKSEQNVGNTLWKFAVPNHYEEQLRINVQRLVDELTSDLTKANQLKSNLFYYHGGSCFWNVPAELQFMNSSGSVWHTYDYKTGCITMHPDFTIMLFDGSLVYWEHEGLFVKITYRVNAMERISIMRLSNDINPNSIIETTERESNNYEALEEIIRTRIIPNLWF